MRIVLVNGLWLTASVWTPVLRELQARSVDAVAVEVPTAPGTTFDDQLGAVLGAIDASPTPVIVVGHSAAATLAWAATAARVDLVRRAVFIGGMPVADGEQYAPFFPVEDGVMAFPGWGPFEGADSDDLDADQRAEIERDAVPVPGEVATGVVHYASDDRFDIGATLVCPEFSAADAKEWLEAGELPELARVRDLEYVDLDSGHWPMVSAPRELAEILAAIVD